MIATAESYDSTAAGLRIHRHLFLPESGSPTGRAVMLHGLGDHLGCHLAAAEWLCARGYACAGVDAPGHGKSEGRRGHLDRFETIYGLIDETLAWLDDQFGVVGPRLLYAHSTGAFFALHYLRARSIVQGQIAGQTLFDRIWLGSPLLRPEHGQPPLLVAAAGLLGRAVPFLTLDTKVRPDRCRHLVPGAPVDPAEALCHHWVGVDLGASLLRHARDTTTAALALADPTDLLLTQGAEDTICPPVFSRELFDAIPARDKTYALLPGLRHECVREPDNSPVREAAGRWLDK
jgi:lysophospholipase